VVHRALEEVGEPVRPFDYVAPRTVGEAVDVLARHRETAKVLAGGQSLVPLLNYRLARPAVVVDVNDLPLAAVRVDGDRVRLGALTRHATLAESPDVRRSCPILAEAAALVGNVRVRTLGTLGGSLAHADPAAELPLAVVALDGRITVEGRSGRRTIQASDFFTGYLTTALDPCELITEIDVPVTRDMGVAVEEFSRRPGDFAVVAVAVRVSIDRGGRADDVRLAFAGVAPAPVRARGAEERLRGHEPTTDRIAQVADAARDALDPASDAFASGAYRTLLAGVLARRALTRAVARAMDGGPG
jgi:CO/xanthine dehydrogenase FAD-binding subunit